MQMVASHHERFNGSGYPQGMTGKDIPIFGHIAGIVDSYDAMVSEQAFSPDKIPPHEAIKELYQSRGGLFHADLVEQFIRAVGMYPTGTLVELNSGEIAVVTEIHGLKRLRPSVMLVLDKSHEPFKEFRIINLSHDRSLSIVQTLKRGEFGIKMDELFL
jgi:HD-GYP domain-containing protein (c-di-GMP phosphodiesterase class II)